MRAFFQGNRYLLEPLVRHVVDLVPPGPVIDLYAGVGLFGLALAAIGSRYDFETEILLRAARRGIPLVGVPVRVYYPPIAERVSHFDPWTDTLRIIGTVLRVLVSPG